MESDLTNLFSDPNKLREALAESEKESMNPLRQEKSTSGYWAEPNTTAVWNYFFDNIMVALDEDMLRITLYLIRHTFGYGKGRGDYITEDQFINGTINKKTGERIDWGAGITTSTNSLESKKAAFRRAIRRLEKLGIVNCRRGIKRTEKDKFATNFYRLYLKKDELKSGAV